MKKKEYQAPAIEVLEAKIEKGFVGSTASSPVPQGTEQLEQGEGYTFS